MSAALCLGYSALAGYALPSSAFSPEAMEVTKAARQVMQDRLRSESLCGNKLLALSQISTAAQAVTVDEDQASVNRSALNNAEQFVLALPDDLPMPESAVDPDGAISLTWFKSHTQIFSVSVGESDRAAYAWLDGSDKGHAVDRFELPVLPNRLLTILRSVVNNERSSIRIA